MKKGFIIGLLVTVLVLLGLVLGLHTLQGAQTSKLNSPESAQPESGSSLAAGPEGTPDPRLPTVQYVPAAEQDPEEASSPSPVPVSPPVIPGDPDFSGIEVEDEVVIPLEETQSVGGL